MPQTTTAQLTAASQIYMAKKVLAHAKYQTVLHQFGKRENIPANGGKSISFTQYADLDLVVNPLTEGQAPAGKALSATAVNATIDQYGDYVTITDLANLTVKHKAMVAAYKALGIQAARTLDRNIHAAISSGTAVRYAGTATTRATLDATSKIKWADIRKEVTRLRNAGAREFTEVYTRNDEGEITSKKSDGNFVLVVDASVEQDLMDDPHFEKAANAYASKDKKNEFYTGTIADFAGVTVVRSNNLPVIQNSGAGGTHEVRQSFIFGMDAYANTDLQKLKTYFTKPGGQGDPLHQRAHVGWKSAAKTCILNNNWMGRIESVSEY